MAKSKLDACLIKVGNKAQIKTLVETDDINNISKEHLDLAVEKLKIKSDGKRAQTAKNIANRQYFLSEVARGQDPVTVLNGMIVNNISRGGKMGVDAEGLALSLIEQSNAKIHKFMKAMKPSVARSLLGIFITGKGISPKQKQMLNDVIEETLNGNTGNADAKAFAQAYHATIKDLLDLIDSQSGNKSRRMDDYGLPQRHDPTPIARAGYDTWRAKLEGKLSVQTMKQRWKGEFTEEKFELALKNMYEAIVTNGASKNINAAKHVDINHLSEVSTERFLIFKDSESWLEYQGEFGSGNLYESMMQQINSLSRVAALKEVFGTDYNQGFTWMKALVMRQNAKKGEGDTRINKAKIATTDSYFNEVSGQRSEAGNIQHIMAGLRAWEVATSLGQATVAAIGDFGFSMTTRGHWDMNPASGMGRYLGQVFSANNRDFAASIGVSADYAISRIVSPLEEGNAMGAGRTKSAADFTLRASGLARHTIAARQAFGLDFNSYVVRDLRKGLKDGRLKEGLERYGFTAEDIEIVKNSQTTSYRGVEYVDPAALPFDVRRKWTVMVGNETNYAVPTPTSRERALTAALADPNSLSGAVIQSQAQFLSFPVTVMTRHWSRVMDQRSIKGGVAYAAAIVALTTMWGGVSHIAKELLAGRQITDEYLNSPEFAGKAFMQGGAGSIFANIVFSDSGWDDFWAAPALSGLPNDLLAIAKEAVLYGDPKRWKDVDSFKDYAKESNMNPILVEALKENLPSQNLWYTKLAAERLVFDAMREFADPRYKQKSRKKERNLYKQEKRRQFSSPHKGTNLDDAVKL